MKLYFLPSACSLAAHILLREAGQLPDLELVVKGTGKTAKGEDYRAISPLGYVPALEFDDGRVLTENTAILAWIAENVGPAAPSGQDYFTLLEEIGFLSTELHKAFSPFFSDKTLSDDEKEAALAKLRSRIGHYDAVYLSKDREFDVAQAYAYVILSWTQFIGFDLGEFPRAQAFVQRIDAREAVKAARAAEAEALAA